MTVPSNLAQALADRYRVERQLGQGGMATVYLADDLRHHRQVALKVLRPELAAVLGAERFLQEIRTTANLQHPHILPLFDSGTVDGTVFYVMPFVAGESLRDRLRRERQLPVPEAIRIATEVAAALDYAHRHDVIHRDVKPENILLHDGQALVADFGIALAAAATGGSRMTETGMSLGTPHYMAPEQAMGERSLDARTDVYALGCVLYEMLTGDPPFQGSSAQAIVAKVMTEKPAAIRGFRDTVSPGLEAAVLTALAKLPADRYASAAAFAAALGQTGTQGEPRVGHGVGRERWLAAAAAGIVTAAVAIAAWIWVGRAPSPPAGTIRLSIDPPSGWVFAEDAPAMSPDGQTVVFRADSGATSSLFVRPLAAFRSVLLPGTANAYQPFFSADGRTVGFVADLQLKEVPTDGTAPPRIIARVAQFTSANFDPSGRLIYAPDLSQGIFRSAVGATVVDTLVSPDVERGESGTNFPEILPDGSALIYGLLTKGGWKLVARRLPSGPPVVLVEGGMRGVFVPPNRLVFTRNSDLYVADFDPAALRITGEPVLLERRGLGASDAERPARYLLAGGGYALFGTSLTGTLAYLVATNQTRTDRIQLFDRTGRELPLRENQGARPRFDLSGRALLVEDSAQIWRVDLDRGGARVRLTTGAPRFVPVGAPGDGTIVVSSYEQGPAQLATITADGGPGRTLAKAAFRRYVGSWCPDGRCVYVTEVHPETGADVRRVAIDGREDVPILRSPFDEYQPRVSPSGTVLAYTSEESGRAEVYLRPAGGTGTAVRASLNGGSEPVWRGDGRELYYREGERLMAAGYDPSTGRLGVPRPLIPLPRFTSDDKISTSYDVSPDGAMIAVATAPPPAVPLRLRVAIGVLPGR